MAKKSMMTAGDMARKRWASVAPAERSRIMSTAAKAFWASLSSEEKSREMKARAKKRRKNAISKTLR